MSSAGFIKKIITPHFRKMKKKLVLAYSGKVMVLWKSFLPIHPHPHPPPSEGEGMLARG